ncbi:carbon-nitrogen hydrolase family protein [Spirochaetota bacterium]
MKIVKVILYQKPLGSEIPDKDINEINDFKPHFICFPEYFFIDTKSTNHTTQTTENQEKQIRRIKLLSKNTDSIVIGGTMPEISGNKLYNTCFIFNRGNILGFYRKKNLFFAEEGRIMPGDKYKVFSAYGIKFGILICADVLNNEIFKFMKKNKAKIIFSPTFSPKREESVDEKFKRDNYIYVNGAKQSSAVIVKVCCVKSKYMENLQARSLIANSEGIIFRVNPHEEDKSLIIKKEIEI